ncbi:hypothetical protein V7793_32690 [Streptomyces sp. KLMMK]|uniref:hypothetical protein n=1 Tax=Streptomyces sp. KLMMK TaxID=3109353 RepID=UPI003008BB95
MTGKQDFPPDYDFKSQITLRESIKKLEWPWKLDSIGLGEANYWYPLDKAKADVKEWLKKEKGRDYAATWIDIHKWGKWSPQLCEASGFIGILTEREPVIGSLSRTSNPPGADPIMKTYTSTKTYNETKTISDSWGVSVNMDLQFGQFNQTGGGNNKSGNASFNYTHDVSTSVTHGHDESDSTMWNIRPGMAGTCDIRFQGGRYVGYALGIAEHVVAMFGCAGFIQSEIINNDQALYPYSHPFDPNGGKLDELNLLNVTSDAASPVEVQALKDGAPAPGASVHFELPLTSGTRFVMPDGRHSCTATCTANSKGVATAPSLIVFDSEETNVTVSAADRPDIRAIEVPLGLAPTVSAPSEIAAAPWELVQKYRDPE